jgi:hypothetical protein
MIGEEFDFSSRMPCEAMTGADGAELPGDRAAYPSAAVARYPHQRINFIF